MENTNANIKFNSREKAEKKGDKNSSLSNNERSFVAMTYFNLLICEWSTTKCIKNYATKKYVDVNKNSKINAYKDHPIDLSMKKK